MKDDILLYLLTYLNIRISRKVEIGIWKNYFFTCICWLSIFNYVLYGLKFWVYVSYMRFEGTMSQILILGFSFDFMQKRNSAAMFLIYM